MLLYYVRSHLALLLRRIGDRLSWARGMFGRLSDGQAAAVLEGGIDSSLLLYRNWNGAVFHAWFKP